MAIHYVAAEHGVLIKKKESSSKKLKAFWHKKIISLSWTVSCYKTATVHSLNLHISSKNYTKCGAHMHQASALHKITG